MENTFETEELLTNEATEVPQDENQDNDTEETSAGEEGDENLDIDEDAEIVEEDNDASEEATEEA